MAHAKNYRTRAPAPKAKSTDPNKRFKPLGGTSRKYRDTETGAILSRRQRDKLVLTGGRSYEQRRKERRLAGIKSPQTRYEQLVAQRREWLWHYEGKLLSRGEIRKSSEMKKLIKDLRTKSNAARGAKARALVQLGLRDETWSFAVGETPET